MPVSRNRQSPAAQSRRLEAFLEMLAAERGSVGRTGVATPYKRIDAAAVFKVFFLRYIALDHGEIEIGLVLRRRQTMTEKNAIGRAERERHGGKQFQIGRVDLLGRIA